MSRRLPRFLRPLILLAAMFVFLSSGLPTFAEGEEPSPSPYSLLNEFSVQQVSGVTVYFRKSTTDMGAIAALMEAGIGDQRADEAHCAHMAEHMVFNYPLESGSSLATLIEGGVTSGSSYFNGYTGMDTTVFWMATPNPSLPSVLTAFLDSLFSHPLTKDAAWDAEIKRSSREIENITTNEVHATHNRMKIALMKETPYAELMFETPLSAVKPETVSGFMKREYSPARLTVVVTGDWDEHEIIEATEHGLEGIDPGQPPATRQVSITPDEYSVLRLPSVKTSRVSIGVGVDSISAEDRSALIALWTTVAGRLQKISIPGLTFPGTLSAFPMKTASAAMFSIVSNAALGEKGLMPLGTQAAAAVRAILADFAEGNVTTEDLHVTVPEPDPEIKAAMDRMYAQWPQSFLDVSTVLGLLVPETNSPVDGIPDLTNIEEALVAEIKTVAAKYSSRMRLTVLYTVQSFSVSRILIPAGIVFAAAAITLLYIRFRRTGGQL